MSQLRQKLGTPYAHFKIQPRLVAVDYLTVFTCRRSRRQKPRAPCNSTRIRLCCSCFGTKRIRRLGPEGTDRIGRQQNYQTSCIYGERAKGAHQDQGQCPEALCLQASREQRTREAERKTRQGGARVSRGMARREVSTRTS